MKNNLKVGATQNAKETLKSVNTNIISLRNTNYILTLKEKISVEKVCSAMNDIFDTIIRTYVDCIDNNEDYDATFDNFEAPFRDLFEKDMKMKIEDVFSESDYNAIIEYLVCICEQLLKLYFSNNAIYNEEPFEFFECETPKQDVSNPIPTKRDDVTFNAVLCTASAFIAQMVCNYE